MSTITQRRFVNLVESHESLSDFVRNHHILRSAAFLPATTSIVLYSKLQVTNSKEGLLV